VRKFSDWKATRKRIGDLATRTSPRRRSKGSGSIRQFRC